MQAVEHSAVERSRTLLVIPDYALTSHGGLTGTMIYWKRIGFRPADGSEK
jgi:hypothetical protein